MRKVRICFIIILTILFSFSQNCRKKSDYILIRETIEDISKNIEKKDEDGFLKLIDESYFDIKKRDKKEIKRLIDEYYYMRRGIVINILSFKIIELNIPRAEVIIDVSVSSGAGKVFRKLANYYGDYYRVRADFIKRKDKWFVSGADWQLISFEELFPESVKILKKLMPEVFGK
jgi:hypothetical protein